jgi:DNA polymerase elongation subunit (family B)
MFKNIHYNNFQKKIYLTEVYNGKTVKLVEDYKYFYYMKDPSGTSNIKDMFGNPVIKKEANDKKHLKSIKESGLELCESDISEVNSFLQERYGNVTLQPNFDDFNVCFIDIEIESGNTFPAPELADYEINLISVYSSKTQTMYTWGNREYTGDSDKVKNYAWIPEEKKRLEHFTKWFRKQKFDIITGWNVKDFDMQYILNRLAKLEVETSLSPLNTVNHKNIEQKDTKQTNYHCDIAGISIIDYLPLYKKNTISLFTLESYSLNFVANFEGVGGKLELDGQINDAYKRDWNKFVEYNIQDVYLVKYIDDKRKFINLTILLASQALVPLEKVSSAVVLVEGYLLRIMHKKKMVMPDRKRQKRDKWKEDGLYRSVDGLQNMPEDSTSFQDFYVKGGHVEAYPGLYNHLMSIDATSLYPHNILQYNVSPETKVYNPSKEQIERENLIRTPLNGIYYRREVGILPQIVKTIFDERKFFKSEMFKAEKAKDYKLAEYFNAQQLIRKILINSMYGVLINDFFHFYDVDNARVITRGGRTLIRYVSSITNSYFREQWPKVYKKYFPNAVSQEPITNDVVVLLDTDSVYMCLDQVKESCAPEMDFLEFAEIMEKRVINPLLEKILKMRADSFGVEQVINFKREGVIKKQLILAKKKYLTLLLKDEDKEYEVPKLKATGIEIKRSDTPKFCRDSIGSVIDTIFEGKNPSKERTMDTLKNVRKEFNEQRIENISFNKSVNDYRKYGVESDKDFFTLNFKTKTPMHVRAAIVYNAIVEKHKLPYMKIDDHSKIKYVHVDDKNILGTNVIGYIGNYPKEFENFFKINKKEQFEKSFLEIIQRIFDVLDWGEINFKTNKLKSLLK